MAGVHRRGQNHPEGLRGKLSLKGSPRSVKFIAGADISYRRFSSQKVVETRTVSGLLKFPYRPFREGPLLLRVFEDPQLIFFGSADDSLDEPEHLRASARVRKLWRASVTRTPARKALTLS